MATPGPHAGSCRLPQEDRVAQSQKGSMLTWTHYHPLPAFDNPPPEYGTLIEVLAS